VCSVCAVRAPILATRHSRVAMPQVRRPISCQRASLESLRRASRPLCSCTTAAAAPRRPACHWPAAPLSERPNGSPTRLLGAVNVLAEAVCPMWPSASATRCCRNLHLGPSPLIVPASNHLGDRRARSRSHRPETWQQHRTPPTTSGAHLNGCGGAHCGTQRRFCSPGRWRLGESACCRPSK
jgi:hypothetical protein